jgi:hypothetical protein
LAVPRCDVGLVVIGIRIDAVVARRAHREGAIRRVYLDVLILPAHANRERSFRKFYLRVAVVEIEKLKCGPRPEPEFGLRYLYLSPRTLVREQLISDGKGSISSGLYPVIHSARLERDISAGQAQPSRKRRRVLRHRHPTK